MLRKLTTLAQSSGSLQTQWQTRMAQSQLARVLLKVQKSPQSGPSNRVMIRQALSRLKTS